MAFIIQESVDDLLVAIFAEPETDVSPERDFKHDPSVARSIRRKMKTNMLAWCSIGVTVFRVGETVDWHAPHTQHLGCCSYKSFQDFVEGGYYTQMRDEAIEEYRRNLKATE
ncbi:MAG TPA: hypothetical protein V6C65_14140 [Allocoleopsis sp.]